MHLSGGGGGGECDHQWTDVLLLQQQQCGGGGGGGGAHTLTAPRTSIDLTSLMCPFYPSLFYFPILTPAAAASAHFLP